MRSDDLQSLIALTTVPHIGDVHMKTLLQYFGSAQAVFRARRHELERVPGIGSVRAAAIRGFRDFSRAGEELLFMEKYQIRVFVAGEPDYPARLMHCYDAPAVLYFRGNCDLDASRMVSIVGTRDPTHYGKDWLVRLIEDLASYRPLIVSGLAYGIDTIAHRQALRHGLETVGVVAHGLDRIYPHANKSMAREMTAQGGLLTDFMSGTPPDGRNFPSRNRIVAGISDATIVVETGHKGGSMITADIANSYNKDVCALPGRATDDKSDGCNRLIREHRAHLVTGAKEIVELLNWDAPPASASRKQRSLFPELTASEQAIISILEGKESVGIDELRQLCGMKPGETASAILNLEMMGLVASDPGKRYRAL